MSSRILAFVGAATLVAALGCAPSIEHLERHLDASNYDRAVAAASGDPALETELAALVIEHAAAAGSDPAALVSALAAAGAPGKRALDRIVERGVEPAGSLARIALERRRAPRGPELKRFLAHASSDVRAAAASAWARELGFERLEALALDPEPRVRSAAVGALAALEESKRAAALLRETLRLDPDPRVRAAAARQGPALGKRALESLRDALGDENMGVRHGALRGLGKLGTTEARALIEDRIAGPIDETVVVAAAELARLGSEAGRQRFDEALAAKSPGVRATALLHLGRAGIGDADQIQRRALDDEAPQVVLLAASLLLREAEPDGPVAEALRRLIADRVAAAPEARDMLAVIGDSTAIAEVETVLADAAEGELLKVLARVRRASKLRARFVQLLADERESVRLAAARAVLAS
jgi:HEAT repeat protein